MAHSYPSPKNSVRVTTLASAHTKNYHLAKTIKKPSGFYLFWTGPSFLWSKSRGRDKGCSWCRNASRAKKLALKPQPDLTGVLANQGSRSNAVKMRMSLTQRQLLPRLRGAVATAGYLVMHWRVFG